MNLHSSAQFWSRLFLLSLDSQSRLNFCFLDLLRRQGFYLSNLKHLLYLICLGKLEHYYSETVSPFAKGPDRVEIGKVEVALRNKDLEYAQVNGTDGMMLAMFSLQKHQDRLLM